MLGGWSDRTVLVTGGAGYIGSRLVRDLAVDPRFEGVRIRILDNLQRGTYAGLMDLPRTGRYAFVEADIMDGSALPRALEGVAAVIHLAALVHTPFSFEHARWTGHVNHWGTAHLLERVIDAGVARFVFASSASVYGPGGVYAEDSPCRPIGPYSTAKLRAEEAVLAAGERGLGVTVLRIATVYGQSPGVRFDAVPNRFAYLAGTGRPLAVHGTGGQVRAVIDVADASDALRFCLAEVGRTRGEVFNAVGESPEIRAVAALVAGMRGVEVRFTDQDVLTHFDLVVSGDKLAAAGWTPSRSLEVGLRELLDRLSGFSPA